MRFSVGYLHILLSLVLLLAAGSGCGVLSSFSPEVPTPLVAGKLIRPPLQPQIIQARVNRSWTEAIRRRAPLTVEVAQAFFEEEDLKIKIHLTAQIDLPAEDVILGVAGLREGDMLEERFQSLNEVITGRSLKAGQKAAFIFSLTTPELTEYQVRCSWGEDARALLAELKEPRVTEALSSAAEHPASLSSPSIAEPEPGTTLGLRLENMSIEEEVEECAYVPCNVIYTVQAELVNVGRRTVRGAHLALGLYWVNEGALPIVPKSNSPRRPNEEHIDLGALELPPGGVQNIRVKVDRSVPQVPGGQFIPHLRLLPEPPAEPDNTESIAL